MNVSSNFRCLPNNKKDILEFFPILFYCLLFISLIILISQNAGEPIHLSLNSYEAFAVHLEYFYTVPYTKCR